MKSVAFSGSYNDLSDTPAALPANGGNADTVNSLRTGSNYRDIFSTSLTYNHSCWNKKVYVSGQSSDSSANYYIENAPEVSNAVWYEVETIGNTAGGSRAYQIAIGCYSHQKKTIFIRTMHDGNWSKWQNLRDDAYVLPTATSSVLGGVKIGSHITNTNGTISISKSNVTNALGYTPLSVHPTITKSADTTSTATPSHGGTITMVDSVTRDSNGHVTKVNTKTVTLPSDNNTDTKVTQTNYDPSGYTYWRPLVIGSANSATEGFTPTTKTDSVVVFNNLSVQPSTGTIKANMFKGKLDGTAQYTNYLKTHINTTGTNSLIDTSVHYYETTNPSDASLALPHGYIFLMHMASNVNRGVDLAIRWDHNTPQLWCRTNHDTWSSWHEIGVRIITGPFSGTGNAVNISLGIPHRPRFICYWNTSTAEAYVGIPGNEGDFTAPKTTNGVSYKYMALV